MRVVWDGSNTHSHYVTGRCCIILTSGPIVLCASMGYATQAYLVSTLTTTLGANKANHWVMQKSQHDHECATSTPYAEKPFEFFPRYKCSFSSFSLGQNNHFIVLEENDM